MIDISIIIPFLNEEDNVPHLVGSLSEYSRSCSSSLEFVFVDDGSTDDSVNRFRSELAGADFHYQIISLSKNYGSHAALRAGISQCKGQFTGFLYADLQDPVELIEQLHDGLKDGKNNIVWGTRKTDKRGFLESLFSRSYAYLMKKFVSPEFPEEGFDIVMFDQKVRKQINLNPENNSSIFLQILTLGFNQDRVSYDKKERKGGQSKWTFSKRLKLFIDSFVAFSYFPIRLVTISGIVFFVIGGIWTLYIIGRQLLVNDLAEGWPALLSVLLVGFGVTNIGLGIVAEYLWRTLDASRGRPVYIIDHIYTKETSA